MGKIAKRRARYVLDYYDHVGHHRRKTMPAGAKKAEAEEELRIIQDRLAKGYYRAEREIPRFEALATTWLNLKSPTYAGPPGAATVATCAIILTN